MIAEAEKYKEEDDKNASRIEAKSKLENYCYSVKNSMEDEKLKENINTKARFERPGLFLFKAQYYESPQTN
jgi:molecular chaperone DnaK (HSP70)